MKRSKARDPTARDLSAAFEAEAEEVPQPKASPKQKPLSRSGGRSNLEVEDGETAETETSGSKKRPRKGLGEDTRQRKVAKQAEVEDKKKDEKAEGPSAGSRELPKKTPRTKRPTPKKKTRKTPKKTEAKKGKGKGEEKDDSEEKEEEPKTPNRPEKPIRNRISPKSKAARAAAVQE